MTDAKHSAPAFLPPTKRMIEEIIFLADRYRQAHGFKSFAETCGRAVNDKAFLRKILDGKHPPAATVKKLALLETFLLRAPLIPGEAHDAFVAEWRAKNFPDQNSDQEHSEAVSA